MNSGSPSLDALLLKYTGKKEREVLEAYADLFALLKTAEKLERAYVRDAVAAADYEPACERLIGQFRTLWDSVRSSVPDVEAFMAAYNMQCPMGWRRLQAGMPATIEHNVRPRPEGGGGGASVGVAIAETVQHFITAMDALKLNMTAVDQVYPLLSDLVQSLMRVTSLPPDLAGPATTRRWMTRLHGMPASRELGEEDVRQLLFDLESAYNEFMSAIAR